MVSKAFWPLLCCLIFENIQASENYYPLMTIIREISASSFLVEPGIPKFTYHPSNLYDENLNTAWLEGSAYGGIGEFVEFEFFTPVKFSSICISNGYCDSTHFFSQYGRVRQFEILINSRKRRVIRLEDRPEAQEFKLGADLVSKIRLTIKAIYPGVADKHAACSELTIRAELSDKQRPVLKQAEIDVINVKLNEGSSYSNDTERLFSQLTPIQLEALLLKEYPQLDGAGNDDRMYSFVRNALINSLLVPVLLKSIYQHQMSLFLSESSNEDTYIDVARIIWKTSPVGLPLVYYSGRGFYNTYYDMLERGDTRIVPKYLEIIKNEGIWHEFCCQKMPNEILLSQWDTYTQSYLQDFLNREQLNGEVRAELQKALDSMAQKHR
jgi:hypothetical protein